MLQCGVVGKWTGGAVRTEKGKLIGDYKVAGPGRCFGDHWAEPSTASPTAR